MKYSEKESTCDDIPDDSEHVFIVGSSRSGTTLLASILFASGVYAVYRAETKLLDDCPSKYGSLASNRAYRNFTNDWFNSRQFNRSGLTEAEFDEAVADCRGNYLQMLEGFMGAVASKQDKKLWIEDTPSSAYRLKEISRAFPNARVIHIVRDGRAVALSLARLNWTGTRAGDHKKDLCYSALKWEQSVQAVISSRHYLADRYHEIRYEDLVTQPHQVIGDLVRFLGIKISADTIMNNMKDNALNGDSQSIPMTPNTAFGDIDSAISAKPAYRWKEEISSEDLACLNSYIGKTLRYYQYTVAADHGLGFLGNARRHYRTMLLCSKRAIKRNTPLGRMTRTPLEINEA